MARRNIRKEWVQEAIRNPGKLIDVRHGKKQAIKRVNSEEISVIYAKEEHNYIVVTVFWGR